MAAIEEFGCCSSFGFVFVGFLNCFEYIIHDFVVFCSNISIVIRVFKRFCFTRGVGDGIYIVSVKFWTNKVT